MAANTTSSKTNRLKRKADSQAESDLKILKCAGLMHLRHSKDSELGPTVTLTAHRPIDPAKMGPNGELTVTFQPSDSDGSDCSAWPSLKFERIMNQVCSMIIPAAKSPEQTCRTRIQNFECTNIELKIHANWEFILRVRGPYRSFGETPYPEEVFSFEVNIELAPVPLDRVMPSSEVELYSATHRDQEINSFHIDIIMQRNDRKQCKKLGKLFQADHDDPTYNDHDRKMLFKFYELNREVVDEEKYGPLIDAELRQHATGSERRWMWRQKEMEWPSVFENNPEFTRQVFESELFGWLKKR